MTEKKYSLDFVNDGEPFEISNWTVKKHEKALDELVKNTKSMSNEEKDKQFRYYVILQSLREIDKNVKIESIKNMHVEDLIALFQACYNKGKKGIEAKNFRQGKKKSPKKSTSKKN